MTKLYHVDIGIPAWAESALGGLACLLNYTNHARRAMADDGLTMEDMPVAYQPGMGNIIEVETCEKRRVVTKFVTRIPLNEEDDIVLVVATDSRAVKTVWVNKRTDTHKTLRRDRYDVPECAKMDNGRKVQA